MYYTKSKCLQTNDKDDDAGEAQETLKRRGANWGSTEKGDARTLFAIFANFTHENDKFSNKKEGCEPLHPIPGSATVTTGP